MALEVKFEHVSICFTRNSGIPYNTWKGQIATIWWFTCIITYQIAICFCSLLLHRQQTTLCIIGSYLSQLVRVWVEIDTENVYNLVKCLLDSQSKGNKESCMIITFICVVKKVLFIYAMYCHVHFQPLFKWILVELWHCCLWMQSVACWFRCLSAMGAASWHYDMLI